MYSLFLCRPEGTIFTVRRDNFKYGIFPKRGDVISFLYDNYSKKSIPVSPRIYRIRTDLSWEEVIDRYLKTPAHARPLNSMFVSPSPLPALLPFHIRPDFKWEEVIEIFIIYYYIILFNHII